MKKTRVAVVTGATGYVGSNLVQALLRAGWDVTCIVRKNSKSTLHPWYGQVGQVIYDGSADSLINAGKIFRREVVVFHLASMASYHCLSANIGEMIASNITFGAHLLESMRHWGVVNFVNTGSYWQYSKSGQYQPVCLYAATKEAFEDVIGYHVQKDEVQCTNLVLFDVYGPNDPRRKLLQLLEIHARTGEVLRLSPGMQKLDMVYIDDVVAAFITAGDRLLQRRSRLGTAERFAVSSEGSLTLREFVATYEEIMSASLNIIWGGIAYREREAMDPWQPTEREKLEGWRPRYGIREGLIEVRKAHA